MSAHTPGPWRTELITRGSNRGHIAVFGPGADVGTGHCEVNALYDECEANAALIAAAPDLLAAAKLAAEIIAKHRLAGLDQNPFAIHDVLGNAIAKAEGRS